MDAIEIARDILGSAPEINPSNYDHDQVCQLNAAANEAYDILDKALAANQLPPAPVAEELASQPASDATCETCSGHGYIGGPTYYQPDEGGERCPDCNPHLATPVAEELSRGPVAFSKGGNLFWHGSPSAKRSVNCDLYTHPQTAIDVDALAEFIRDMDDGEYIPYHEFAQRICNWIEEQSNDQ